MIDHLEAVANTGPSSSERKTLDVAWGMRRDAAAAIDFLTPLVLRYGLVLVIGWIGAMKFTAYEASGIEPLIAGSPLMAWLYRVLSVQGASNLLGVVELAIAAMLASKAFAPRIAAVGGCLAAAMFLTTLTFLLSTPGWESSLGGFPAVSAMPGQFLLKDVVLLGAALWCVGDAVRALQKRGELGSRSVA